MVLQTRQKSMAGVAQKATQGVFLGGSPPLGYDVEEVCYGRAHGGALLLRHRKRR